MSNKFLTTSTGSINLSNGTVDVFAESLGADNLEASRPLRTNAVKKIVSSNLDISDINDLQSELTTKQELTFVNNDSHTNPPSGQTKLYVKSDGTFYKLDENGNEQNIGGSGYELIPTNSNTLGIHYEAKYDKTTWLDTGYMSTDYNLYNYFSSAIIPSRNISTSTQTTTTPCSTETDLDTAIANQQGIIITNSFTLTTPKTINYPVLIRTDGNWHTLTGDFNGALFTISSDNSLITNIELVNTNTGSNCTCINFTSTTALNNTVFMAYFQTNESAIWSANAQIAIEASSFTFVGTTPDSHRYIFLSRTTGTTQILNNTFRANGDSTPSTACVFFTGQTYDYSGGTFIFSNNTSDGTAIQRVGIMETLPSPYSDFKMYFTNNTILTNTDFFILYGDDFSGISEIVLSNNNVTLIPTSVGFKGLIGIDKPSSTPVAITFFARVRASLNALPTTVRSDYEPFPKCTTDFPIVCYRAVKFSHEMEVNVEPPLVYTYSGGGGGGGVTNPYVGTLIVSDLETDDTFSLNQEIQKISNISSATNNPDITNFDGEIHVAKIKSASHNTEIEFEQTGDMSLTTDGVINITSGGDTSITTVNNDIQLTASEIRLNSTTLTANGQTVLTKDINPIAIGNSAGLINQTLGAVAIGDRAGVNDQSVNAVAIGKDAGENNQGGSSVAVGALAGENNQGAISVAIGIQAGQNNQGGNAIAIGTFSAQNTQGQYAVAIGYNAGRTNQAGNALAIGNGAGGTNQGGDGIAIGRLAGQSTQGGNAVAIGNQAGSVSQQPNSVALGVIAGQQNQGSHAVAIGHNAGNINQGAYSVAIGDNAGNNQGANAIAIGKESGQTQQGNHGVAMGYRAGQSTQGDTAVAIGKQAGSVSQQANSVAVGVVAGEQNQGAFSVALGCNAGNINQGAYSIAIGNGAGSTSLPANAICLNASSSAFSPTTEGVFMSSIKNKGSTGTTKSLVYDSATKEVHTIDASTAGNIEVISHSPAITLFKTVVQTVPQNVGTKISWDVTEYSQGGSIAPSYDGTNYNIQINKDGLYVFTYDLTCTALNTSGLYQSFITVNNSTATLNNNIARYAHNRIVDGTTSSTISRAFNGSVVLKLQNTDTVQLWVTTSTSVNVPSGVGTGTGEWQRCEFTCTRISPEEASYYVNSVANYPDYTESKPLMYDSATHEIHTGGTVNIDEKVQLTTYNNQAPLEGDLWKDGDDLKFRDSSGTETIAYHSTFIGNLTSTFKVYKITGNTPTVSNSVVVYGLPTSSTGQKLLVSDIISATGFVLQYGITLFQMGPENSFLYFYIRPEQTGNDEIVVRTGTTTSPFLNRPFVITIIATK